MIDAEILHEETINFTLRTIKKNDDIGYVVATDKNPYIAVGRTDKLEAIIVAFTKYLERRAEIENVDISKDAE